MTVIISIAVIFSKYFTFYFKSKTKNICLTFIIIHLIFFSKTNIFSIIQVPYFIDNNTKLKEHEL